MIARDLGTAVHLNYSRTVILPFINKCTNIGKDLFESDNLSFWKVITTVFNNRTNLYKAGIVIVGVE